MNQEPTIPDAEASPLLADRGEPVSAVAKAHPHFEGVRAIYFDLDDTLCGYWDASNLGLRQAFERLGPEGFTVEEMVGFWAEAFRGFAPNLKNTPWYAIYLKTAEPTRTELMRRALLLAGIADDDLAHRLGQEYMSLRDKNLKLFPDAWGVLTQLKARYPLGLITNGPADVQRQEIATVGIEPFFGPIFIEGEVGIGKPSQEVFQRAADAMGISPSELLMVGNSYGHDIAPALKYGWKAVWTRRASDIPPSQTSVEELPDGAAMPDAIIQHLSELLPLLGIDA